MITGENIILRAPEPSDIDLLYQWENVQSLWHLSNNNTPFSKFSIEQFILNAGQDIYTLKQIRLMIELKDKSVAGCIDLFDFDPQHSRAGIGLLVFEPYRKKGYATEAIELIKKYAFDILHLHQLYCNILANNEASMKLFQNLNFKIAGVKKEWVKYNYQWQDEIILQLINPATIPH